VHGGVVDGVHGLDLADRSGKIDIHENSFQSFFFIVHEKEASVKVNRKEKQAPHRDTCLYSRSILSDSSTR
jgi:hypothetical protein